MEQEFVIKNYICYEVSEFLVIQTEDAILKIFNENMKKFLKDYETKKIVSIIELKNYFSTEVLNNALLYLQENGLLQTYQEMNFDIQRLVAISNDKNVLYELDKYLESDVFSKSKVETITFEQFINDDVQKNDFLLCILNPYSTELVKKVYKKMENKEAYLLLGYPYNFEFFFDNIYNYYWSNPNHFDHIGFIDERSFSEDNNMTYKELLDLVFSSDSDKKSINFSYKTMNIIMHEIILLLDKYLYLNSVNLRADELMNVFKIDYTSGKVQKDSAIFWELRNLYDE